MKSEYVGGGFLPSWPPGWNKRTERRREARKASEQARWDEQRERIDALDSMIEAHVVALETAVSASLEAAGFHRKRNRCLGWVRPRDVPTEGGKP